LGIAFEVGLSQGAKREVQEGLYRLSENRGDLAKLRMGGWLKGLAGGAGNKGVWKIKDGGDVRGSAKRLKGGRGQVRSFPGRRPAV